MKLALLMVTSLWLTMPAYATAELTPYSASYQVLRSGSDYGDAVRELKQGPDGLFSLYTETEISWMFLTDRRRYWSSFEWQEQQIVTRSFSYKRSGSGRNRQFNGTYEPTERVLDEAAMLEQLRVDLQDPSRTQFRYSMIDAKGEVDQHLYVRAEAELLRLPYGDVESIKIIRVREHSTRETLYWFAPQLAFVLVKMQQIEDGDEVATLVLRRLVRHD
jgi:hypothetical protein